MKGNFVERPKDSTSCPSVEWQNVIQAEDETGSIWNYLPLGCEAQMFAIVTCRGGCGRSPHWIGVGTPFGDGKQYLLECQSWCFWCLPREHFSEEELPLIRQADWARKETKAEIVDFVRTGGKSLRGDTVALSDVADDIESFR
jgi:hypothetical protein